VNGPASPGPTSFTEEQSVMHSTKISEFATETRFYAYGPKEPLALVPGRFAHVVIDMQYGFMPGGIIPVTGNPAIIPNINRISAAVRRAGGTNIFVRFTYDPTWTVYYRRLAEGREARMEAAFSDGAEQHALVAELDVMADDVLLNKKRFSSFTPGTCDLESYLRSAGIDTLVVTGCTSSCCVESTIRDGMQLNFKTIFVGDANATLNDAYHNGAVDNLFGIFGTDLCMTDEILDRLSVAA
jgi:ureidoacrylate peracid hydrolase